MKPWAEGFYNSEAWKKTRLAYAKSKGGLCERCAEQGRITPGVIVHHLTWLNADNITDPSVTLDWNNLELVCRDCHAQIHSGREKRWKVDAAGRVISPPEEIKSQD